LCQQIVGTRSFTSVSGLRVTYCSIEGHEYNVRCRFAEQRDPEWPGDLPESAGPIAGDDLIDQGISWTDAGWTESELAAAFGR
jgi:hypothetical protein